MHVPVYDVRGVNMADVFFSSIHVIHFLGGVERFILRKAKLNATPVPITHFFPAVGAVYSVICSGKEFLK